MNKNDNKDITIDRRSKILEILENKSNVYVKDLSKQFNVSEVTIRNDLDQLEKKHLLIRAHGGAMKIKQVGIDHKLSVKSQRYSKEKQAIGKKGAELINEGETIIIDSGTTTLELAKNLNTLNELTVITNSLSIASQLSDKKNIRVIIPGGYLRHNSLSLVGSIAEQSIQNYFCDKIFLGVDGIDSKYGISTPNIEEAQLNKAMINISREIIVLTDSSKFTNRSFVNIAPILKINTIITDIGIPHDEKIAIENLGINLLLV